MVTSARKWVFMAYRLPREPSAPRLALWRALRRLGAPLVSDGLAALPHSARNLEHLEWLAAGIEEANGTASVWVAEPTTSRSHSRLADEQREGVEAEYRAVLAEARELKMATISRVERRRAVRRLRGQLRRIGSRDYFEASAGTTARAALDELARAAEAVPA